MGARVLVVEDEVFLRKAVTRTLKANGFDVVGAGSAEEAAEEVETRRPDLVMLDWKLPGISGLKLLELWREQGQDFPVIMVTSQGALEDRVRGLDQGADDYLVKPFAYEELLARLRARLRSHGPGPAEPELLELSDRQVDLLRYEVRCGDQRTQLTERETRILAYLAARPGQPASREELLEEVWGYANSGGLKTRTVDNSVYQLRGKIEADPANPVHLITVFGVGYRLEL